LIGKIKQFNFDTVRVCKHCHHIVERKMGILNCPKCSYVSWTETQRAWLFLVVLDVFDNEIECIGNGGRVVDQLLQRVGLSLRVIEDNLKGFIEKAWYLKKEEQRKIAIDKVLEYSKSNLIGFQGHFEDNSFWVDKIVDVSTRMSNQKSKYLEGSQKKLLEVARDSLPEYSETLETWGDIPVLRYTKSCDEEIEIGIRAPVAEYGKAYHICMRVNGAHMYPSKPVQVAGKRHLESWVYRVYHTKGWEENLKNRLKYLVNLEEKTLKVVGAAKKMNVTDIHQTLINSGLSDGEIDNIIDSWQEGSFWDLIKQVSSINRNAEFYLLKKFFGDELLFDERG